MSRPERSLSSRELLSRIGLSEDPASELFDEGALDDLEGDLGAVLCERFALLNAEHPFAAGDLVTWKPGLKNRRVPRYGEPAVIVSVLDVSVFDTDPESGSTYFREPLTLVLGVIWDRDPGRGDFVTFHFDGRRFEPWVG
jgi:hypothetical protein